MSDTGRWIWPFKLEDKIGQGGMGVVYRARFVGNNKLVALKILPADSLVDQVAVARFERELEVLKNLRHPHIVHCFGGVCEDKRRFYAMELITGGSLDRLLHKQGRLPWDRAIDYAVQICAALEFVHGQGIVHRDLKPANLLIAPNGQLKLSDFGLATIAAGSKLTAEGKGVGSYHYLAPEQIREGTAASAQTDLYALGCVLFEMVAGRPPFLGNSPWELLQQQIEKPPPKLSNFLLDCPPALEFLVGSLLEKDPRQRPASAAIVARSLKAIQKPATADAVPANRQGRTAAGEPHWPTPSLRTERIKDWALIGCLIVIAGLAVWNVSLASSKSRKDFEKAESLWIKASQNPRVEVRQEALQALGELGRDSEAAVQALIEQLSYRDETVCLEAARSLGEVGAHAKPAVPALVRLHKQDASFAVRETAATALEKIRNAKAETSWNYYSILIGVGALLIAGMLAVGSLVGRMLREHEWLRRTL